MGGVLKCLMAMVTVIILYPTGALAQPFGMTASQQYQQPQQGSLSCPGGRFVFGQISDSRKDQFMLDTHTGRLWRIAETGKVGIFLECVPYRTETGDYCTLPEGASKGTDKEPQKK